MSKKKKTEWLEISRRGKAQPFLVVDSVLDLYAQGYYAKAHKIKWGPKNYRQFDDARWFGKDDVRRYKAVIEKASRTKENNLFTYGKEYHKRITVHRQFADKYKNQDFSKFTGQELAKIFSQWFEITKGFWSFAYDYIILNLFLPDIVTSVVASKIPDLLEQNKCLGILFEADEASEMRLEKRGLVNIAQYLRLREKKSSDKSIEVRLKNHLKKYAHLGFYYFRGSAYAVKDLKSRLAEYLSLSDKKFKEMLNDFKIQDKNKILTKKLVKKLQLDQQTIMQIRYIKRWGALSNYVDETYGYAVHHLMPLWLEIAGRFDISFQQFYSLTGKEIIAGLSKGKLSAQLKRQTTIRHNEHAFILENGKKRILIGQELKKYIKQELKNEVGDLNIKELKGQPASPGMAKGRVRLVFSIHDVKKVERGNILVASLTNPTYVPAMEKAGAIVTDEGGLLSHAAIISRELKVPCVVGTKVATRVLKDGDIISVDANSGRIIKLKI